MCVPLSYSYTEKQVPHWAWHIKYSVNEPRDCIAHQVVYKWKLLQTLEKGRLHLRIATWGNSKRYRTRRIVQLKMIFVQQYCISGRNNISRIGDKTKDETMVLMVQLRDQSMRARITNRKQCMIVIGISWDLIVYMRTSKADRDPHVGRSSSNFGRHSPLLYPRD